jgi:predicted Zn-ribbon and HTH transcriptional regulator
MADALRAGSTTVKDLSRRFGVPMKTVLEDLDHVRRSLTGGERLDVVPAECLGCGYVFADRRRLATPSRCPVCKKENVAPPEVCIAAPAGTSEAREPPRFPRGRP